MKKISGKTSRLLVFDTVFVKSQLSLSSFNNILVRPKYILLDIDLRNCEYAGKCHDEFPVRFVVTNTNSSTITIKQEEVGPNCFCNLFQNFFLYLCRLE